MESIHPVNPGSTIILTVLNHEPVRLDLFLAQSLPYYSRSFFKKLIEEKNIKVNNTIITKSGHALKENDTIAVSFPTLPSLPDLELDSIHNNISIIYENEDFLIVYKPAGVIVHKPHTHSNIITLADWLIHSFKEIKSVGAHERPGIVHRLDKETSGILVVPRNNNSHAYFGDLFKNRTIQKTYLALVEGHPEKSGVIESPITRDPFQKHKMTARIASGRPSKTYYTVLEYLDNASLVKVSPVTGRTHQIRVHFASIGHPLIGDKTYGKPSKLIERQALHAYQLAFKFKDTYYSFCKEMPKDMLDALNKLKHDPAIK